MPTACTSSKKVKAPYLSARSQIFSIGAIDPHMLYTDSNAIILGTCNGKDASLVSKSAMSLCWKTILRAPECRIPWIIDAWFKLSDRITHSGILLPSVASVASLATKHELNTSADSLPCSRPSVPSNATACWLCPEIFRVPPAPAPYSSSVSCILVRTSAFRPIPR